MEQPLEWFFDVPIVTRIWTSAIAASAVLEQCDIVSRTQLTFNYAKIFQQQEYWRLLTTFVYFGPLSVNLVFHAYYLARYSRMLEESFYRNNTREYGWVLFLAASSLISIASFFGGGTGGGYMFLGPYLSNCLTYIWARRNPAIQISFLGFFTFTAPYLPWVMALFTVILNGPSKAKGQLMGILIGHIIFFFEDIYPPLNEGKRLLAPPWQWFERQHEQQQQQHLHQD